MKLQTISISIVALIVGLIAGFSLGRRSLSDQDGPPGTHTQPAMGSREYAMNVVVSNVPFWIETRKTWEAIGKALPGVGMTFGGPPSTDAQLQAEELDALIARRVAGIVIAPADSDGLTAQIDRAVAAGIPVVTYLIDAPKSHRATYVAPDQEAAGRSVARYVAQQIGETGQVAIAYAQAGNAEQEARVAGVRDALRQFAGIQEVALFEDKYDERIGAEALQPILTKHPDLRAVIGCNSRSALGAATALREAGRQPGQVIVTGWDYDNDLIRLIDQNWAQASVAQPSEFMTYLAFSVLRGTEWPGLSGGSGGRPFASERIVVPTTLITKQNAKAYLRE